MQASLHKELVLDALSMALCQRRPGLGLLHHSDHSDRGSQYASTAFQDKLGTAGIVSSMSRRGNLSESGFRCAGTTPLWGVSWGH